jgi:hypothetical protein
MNDTTTTTKYVVETYTSWDYPKVRIEIVDLEGLREIKEEDTEIRSVYKLGSEVKLEKLFA